MHRRGKHHGTHGVAGELLDRPPPVMAGKGFFDWRLALTS
jgi:hypothetical protein